MYNFYNMNMQQALNNLYYQAAEKLKKDAYDKGFDAGRAAGFAAGYAAAQGQPQEKIEQAYQQGIKDAALLRPIRRGGGY